MWRGVLAAAVWAATVSAASHYDLVVLGGGSGGRACAKEAAALGARVAVCDYVEPSPQGATWGLGGTCVNVGCIPKKLMHEAALVGETLRTSEAYGYGFGKKGRVRHSWTRLVEGVQNYVKSLNFKYRVELRSDGVEYLNALAHFVDARTISARGDDEEELTLTADHVLIAVGGRPHIPNIPGAREFGVTSDDVFSLSQPPGRTLVVGGGYIALETAGFLRGLGFDVVVAHRSQPLKGFDTQCVQMLIDDLAARGVAFLPGVVPARLEKDENGEIEVLLDGSARTFDTVVFATGRDPSTTSLQLPPEVELSPGGKVRRTPYHIHAVGDCRDGSPELQPIAVDQGRRLARRLFGGSDDSVASPGRAVPTTIFTPLEFGTVGLSEEAAVEEYGADEVEVYCSKFQPLCLVPDDYSQASGFVKIVCRIQVEDSSSPEVVGLHFVGPHAGEVVQGFAVALGQGLSLQHLQDSTAIHPTSAEKLVNCRTRADDPAAIELSGC